MVPVRCVYIRIAEGETYWTLWCTRAPTTQIRSRRRKIDMHNKSSRSKWHEHDKAQERTSHNVKWSIVRNLEDLAPVECRVRVRLDRVLLHGHVELLEVGFGHLEVRIRAEEVDRLRATLVERVLLRHASGGGRVGIAPGVDHLQMTRLRGQRVLANDSDILMTPTF